MKQYIKLQYDNLDFDGIPNDLVQRREVYAMLNDIGGAGAEEEYFKGWDTAIDTACDQLNDVDSVLPVTFDAEALARMLAHGEWMAWEEKFPNGITRKKNNLGVFCSVCGSHADNISEFCPNCGAKMDLEESE